MAMHVAQAFNSEMSKALLKQEFQAHAGMYKDFNKNALQIIDFLTGDHSFENKSDSWMQALLYSLLVKC